MTNPVQILVAEMDGKDGVFVTFSDGTSAGYVVEELLELRPKREPLRRLWMIQTETLPTTEPPPSRTRYMRN